MPWKNKTFEDYLSVLNCTVKCFGLLVRSAMKLVRLYLSCFTHRDSELYVAYANSHLLSITNYSDFSFPDFFSYLLHACGTSLVPAHSILFFFLTKGAALV